MMRTATLTILALLLTACSTVPGDGGWTKQDTVLALKLGLRVAKVTAFERVEAGKMDRVDYDLLVAAAEAGINAYQNDGAINAREAAWLLIDALVAAALGAPQPTINLGDHSDA